MLALLRWISLRHLVGAPLRSSLTVLGVAVGVATMVGVTAINTSVMSAFRSTVDTIAGKADLTLAGSQVGFDDSVIDKVKAVPGVAHASGAITAVAPVDGSPGETLMVLGVDLLDDGYFRSFKGVDRDIGSMAEDLEFLNSTDRLLVSERFAAAHHLRVGDSFRLATSAGIQPFVVHALIKDEGPVKAFGGSVAVMYLGSAQEAFHRGRNIDRIEIAADPKVGVDEVQRRIVAAVGTQYDVERPSRRGGSVEKMVRSFQMGLNLGSGVALLVGVFLVYNTVSIGVVQRRREIGTLRALGATRRRLRALFALEALVMGAVGTAIGLPLGVVIARGAIRGVSDTVSAIYVQVNANDVHVGPAQAGLGILLGIFGSVFAALRPAIHASRIQPIEALRRDMAAGLHPVSWRSGTVLAGLTLLVLVYPCTWIPPPIENLPVGGYLAVFCTLMGASLVSPLILRGLQKVFAPPGQWAFGIAGRLAADNFARAPGRTAVPVSALAVGVAMTVCIAAFVGSFESSADRWIAQSVPADLFVTSSSKLAGVQNTPMEPRMGDEIESIPDVEAVDRVRILQHDVLGLRIYVISLVPEIYERRGSLQFLEGKLPTSEERENNWLTISENLARRRNLHAGDSFEMSTPSGVHSYRVRAIVIDYTSDQGSLFMDRRVFIRDFKDDRVDSFEVYVKDKSRLAEVRQEITRRLGKRFDLYVLTNKELHDEALNLVEGAFSVTYAMEVVAVLLALLGVINTLLAAVLDRTREIGLLRAIGAARKHVIQLFTGEAAFMGLSGGALGVLSGTVMGYVVTKVIGVEATGWSFPFVFPTQIALQMVTAATVCAVAAGLYPARRAAGLNVVEALAYE
jgi:putative ABC transport system permease protein